jgi:UDP-N-acetylglucosamine--N-acetylmuramyl-(pentapeptide) pyrophosphoryl-undecaprenol N-acetylglucosamine transferase
MSRTNKVDMRKQVLILAGGGGHTGYAYALAQALHGKVTLSFIVPEDDVLSYKKLSRFGKVNTLIKSRGPTTPASKFVQRLAKAFVDSVGKVTRKSNVVVSTGSNFCIPPAVIAWMKGIPVINIESSVRFSKASRTVVLLKPLSRLTALQWGDQRKLLDGVVVGPILPKPEIKPWEGGYILVTGGTYGHRLLFDAIKKSNLHNVVLQTGKVDSAPYVKAHPEWKIITLTEKFNELLAGAEIVVTHFGSTVLEAVSYRKPIVLVLNPEWTRTVGLTDAQSLAEKVNAVFVSEINLKSIIHAIDAARNREPPVLPNGAQNLATEISKILMQ